VEIPPDVHTIDVTLLGRQLKRLEIGIAISEAHRRRGEYFSYMWASWSLSSWLLLLLVLAQSYLPPRLYLPLLFVLLVSSIIPLLVLVIKVQIVNREIHQLEEQRAGITVDNVSTGIRLLGETG